MVKEINYGGGTFMNRKDLFQKRVEDAVYNIANYVMQNLEGDKCVGRAKYIKETLSLNAYVFNEATGRLKAIGFLSEVKHFNKTQISLRADNEQYYYKVDLTKHPDKFIETDEAKILLEKRQAKLRRKREYDKKIFCLSFELDKILESKGL